MKVNESEVAKIVTEVAVSKRKAEIVRNISLPILFQDFIVCLQILLI